MTAPRRAPNVDVLELLRRLQIQGQRRGRDFWARCPLSSHGHEERTASWRIHDEPGHTKHALHVCYGCGGGGGPIALVRDLLRLDAEEARDWLGSDERAELLPRLEIAVSGTSLVRGFKLPAAVRFRPFEDWPETPRRYAADRGLTAAQIDRWGIGYAVDGDLGGRIVIPVRAGDGRLAAYVGRAFLGSLRRYEEPTEGDGADLNVMFGEEHWSPPGARPHLWLAEGTFDALAIERAVGGPVAALRGSQFGDFDAGKGGALHGLRRLAAISTFDAVTIVTDPDAAGDKAALAVREAAGRWCQIRRVVLPRGTDAAELARTAPGDFLRRLRAPVALDLGR